MLLLDEVLNSGEAQNRFVERVFSHCSRSIISNINHRIILSRLSFTDSAV